MRLTELSADVQHVWRVALLVQAVEGFIVGIECYIWAPFFYEKLSTITSPSSAMLFTTLQVGLIHIAIAFLEVPTGALGDVLGRKWSVVCSYLNRIIFFSLLAFIPFCHSITLILLLGVGGAIASALSYSFFSGSFTAWCVDRLRETAPQLGYEHLLARAQTVRSLARMVGAIVSILLFVYHLAYIAFVLGVVVSFGCVIFCLGEMTSESSLHFLERTQISVAIIIRRMGTIVSGSFTIFRRSPAILALVGIYSSFAVLINLVAYFWPIYLRSHITPTHQTVYWIGLVLLMSLANASGAHGLTVKTRLWQKGSQIKARHQQLRRLFISACLCTALAILLLSWAAAQGHPTGWFLVGALVISQLALGLVTPCFDSLMNNYIPDNHAQERATILSIASLMRNAFVMLLAIPTGGSSGETTAIGWAIPAGLLLIATLVGRRFLVRAQSRAPDILATRIENNEPEESEKG